MPSHQRLVQVSVDRLLGIQDSVVFKVARNNGIGGILEIPMADGDPQLSGIILFFKMFSGVAGFF